jgi:hypothetical protein
MQLKTLLSIYAVVAVIFCLGLLLFPAFWIKLYGAQADPQATLLLRLTGALFGGPAVMAWIGRNAEPSKSRDAMVMGFIATNALAAVVAVWGALSGVYNQFAWGPVATFAILAVCFLAAGRANHSVAIR